MPGRKIRLTSGSSLIIIGTSLSNSPSKTIKGNYIVYDYTLTEVIFNLKVLRGREPTFFSSPPINNIMITFFFLLQLLILFYPKKHTTESESDMIDCFFLINSSF
jgi:hypothetical protein